MLSDNTKLKYCSYILKQQAEAPQLAVPYLEAALAAGSASHERFDNDLAVKYLDLVLHKSPGAPTYQILHPKTRCCRRPAFL